VILHLALLALAAFCIWEAARPLLPYNLPDAVVAALLLAVAGLLDTFVPERELGLLAVVAVVGVLHQKFGATGSGGYAVRLPQRRSKIGLP
jgi:hypothetical protein